MPDAVTIMVRYVVKFGWYGEEHFSRCLQVGDLGGLVSALQQCCGFDVAASVAEFLSVLTQSFSDSNCEIFVKLLDPLFSDMRALS
jgi:hypothetical protein